MKLENIIIKLNRFFRYKKYRLFISVLAIGHGIIRISEELTFTRVSFGTDILFGILLIVLGMLLGLTSASCLRNNFLAHIVTALLASLYALLGAAMIQSNISSAYTSFMIVLFLLLEEVFIYEH